MKIKELLPQPWHFEWFNKGGSPAIVADNGRAVCFIQTGRLEGPYPTEVIEQIGQMLLRNVEQNEMIKLMAEFISSTRGGCPAEDATIPEFDFLNIIDCNQVCGQKGRGARNPETDNMDSSKCWLDYFKYKAKEKQRGS